MRIAIATVQVPFIRGGAEVLVEELKAELVRREHEAEIVSIPFKWYPSSVLVDGMMMGRLMDLTEVNGERIDRVIAVKFPAYYLAHPDKVLWLCHQHRQAYDLWGTPYGDLHGAPGGEDVRRLIMASDAAAFRETRALYTISRNVAQRIERYNGIAAVPLYHPPAHHERLGCSEYGDFVFCPGRIDPMKRQRLLVEAAAHARSGVRVVIAGTGSRREMEMLADMVAANGLERRVELRGWISDDEKLRLYATCRAVYYGAVDEDYGYVPLEAMFAAKPVIVHPDAGGPLEFVVDGRTGMVVPSDAGALAQSIDALADDCELAARMGREGRGLLAEHRIDWDHVVGCLLEGHG
jgi:glycosyltransferase involved in cell wall biosynthesis